MKDLHHISETGRLGLIAIAIIGLVMLAAWCFTHERLSALSQGREMGRDVSRCALYRRCCRPVCHFVELTDVRM